MPGLGFGSGIERLMMVMDSLGIPFPEEEPVKLFIACADAAADETVQVLVHTLRKAGIACERDTAARSLKAQMKYADKTGAQYVAVIGGNELSEGHIELKNMSTGDKISCGLNADDIAAALN